MPHLQTFSNNPYPIFQCFSTFQLTPIFQIYSIIVSPFTLRPSWRSFPCAFTVKPLKAFSSLFHYEYISRLLDLLVTRTILDEHHKYGVNLSKAISTPHAHPSWVQIFALRTNQLSRRCDAQAESLLQKQRSRVRSPTGWIGANPALWGVWIASDLQRQFWPKKTKQLGIRHANHMSPLN